MIHNDSGFCSFFIESMRVLETTRITDQRLLDPFGDRDFIPDSLLARRDFPPDDQLPAGCVGQVSPTTDARLNSV